MSHALGWAAINIQHFTFLVSNSITLNICKVHEISHYWKWVDEVFIPSLGPYTYYDGVTPYESNFLGDTPNAYLLGVARLRQLRIKKGKCCPFSIKHPCSSSSPSVETMDS